MRVSGFLSHGSLVFLLLFLVALPALRADPLYSIVNLGSLGTGAAQPAGINNSGTVVGFTTDASGNQVPVTFNGQASPLPGIGQANGINAAGTVVGTSYSSGAPFVAEWSNGQAANLGLSGYGTAINDAGQIAGGMLTPAGQLHAFLWSNGNLVDLGTLPGMSWSSAYGINRSGQVVGTSSAGGRSSAFVSNGNTLTAVAGSLGGANSYGMAINNSGTVAGSAQTAQGYLHAFESTANGMIDLGTLGGSQSYAYGINDAGTVVGYSFLAGNQSTDAFVYLGGVLMDLNTLLSADSGWSVDAAYGIDNNGDIAAVGTLNNQLYAVELQPTFPRALGFAAPVEPLAVPEPGPLLLTGAGLFVLCAFFRRRARPTPSA